MNVNRTSQPSELEWLLQKVEIVRAAWKFVLISFVTLSILGCAALYAVTQPVYSSSMVVPLTANLQALIDTDAILVPVARKRQQFASKLAVSELKKGSGLFSISVTDHSPQSAQAILAQVLAQLVLASKPSGTILASTQHQIASQQRALTELKELSAVLKENASRAKAGSEGELYARSLAILISDIAAKEQKVWELQSYLEGFKVEDVVVPPSLASRPDPTGLPRKFALVLLVSLLVPISFVLLRDLWRTPNGNATNLQRAA